MAGMRRSEVSALRWAAVDEAAGGDGVPKDVRFVNGAVARGEALCRLHGGRLPAVAERWSRGANSAAGNIVLPARRPAVSEATRVAGLRLFRPGGG